MKVMQQGWAVWLGLSVGVLLGVGGSVLAQKKVAALQGGYVMASQTPAYVIAKGKASVKILLDRQSVGAKEAYLGILTALPGAKVPSHRHPKSAEILYVLEGHGAMTLGSKKFRVKPGMAVYIPPNTPHSFHVDTKVQPFKAVQVYAKPGPEQRFKKGKKAME